MKRSPGQFEQEDCFTPEAGVGNDKLMVHDLRDVPGRRTGFSEVLTPQSCYQTSEVSRQHLPASPGS